MTKALALIPEVVRPVPWRPDKTRLKELRAARDLAGVQAMKEVALELIGNPVFGLVAAFVLIEYLQRHNWMPSIAGTVLEGALVAGGFMESLAKSGMLRDFVQGAQAGGQTLATIAPLLLAAGA